MTGPVGREPQNINRRRLLAYVRENPGASLQEIADHLHVARNAATYHVRVLKQRRLLVTRKHGPRALHFVPEVEAGVRQTLLGLLRRQNVGDILGLFMRSPTMPWRQAARHLDMSAHSVRWHVRRLESAGLIQIVPSESAIGHQVFLHPDVRAEIASPDNPWGLPPHAADEPRMGMLRLDLGES